MLRPLLLLVAALSALEGRAWALPRGAKDSEAAWELGALRDTGAGSRPRGWDSPACTEGVVSVLQGERAVMSCNLSNPFTHVIIWHAHGEDRVLFNVTAPGHFPWRGWQPWARGGVAQLVVAAAQVEHAGRYMWHLVGMQRNNGQTTLAVTEPQDPETGGERELLGSALTLLAEAQPQTRSVVGAAVPSLLVLVICALAWWMLRQA
ncbi:secreted and transmembrane protein 1 isoform X4 [Tupaia chinensis]|uniref:secreted and transmembrane protein 1 isoform X4 n=1 Tax=Tupaia chinensis TaxID=246437 RepID=UPI0003C91D04|nr:secreted and transmembrane protein 1 isoform X4 [Tupaia chinensis]XP_006145666.1 secreted and transmembrane protein 1 isoform X4 [Tupaia chinensis]XP_014442202.1 secreted and transmembrane protein 1 isoform X4 [Tupaia chinensis]